MERIIIFKNTETGEELVMPVTPKEYQVEHGRKQNTVTLHTVGDVSYAGPAVLLDEEAEFLLPARPYAFCQPGAVLDPFVYLEKLERWSDAGTVLRWVVSGTPVNAAVRLGPIRYREQDGTNDVWCVVPIRGVRQLAPTETEIAPGTVPLAARSVEREPVKANSYTVVAGDTLGAICLRFYGDASLAARLGAYNGIKNINLIRVGQVISTPEKDKLPAAKAGRSGTATATVVVSYGGPNSYHGQGCVDYTDGGTGARAQKAMGLGTRTVSVKAKRGTAVKFTWLNSSRKIAYYTVDGVTKAGADALSVTADKDRKIGVYWG